MSISAAIAALAGLILLAGTNPILALGLGCLALSGYLVVNRIVEQLARIEALLLDIQTEATSHAVADALRSRQASTE